MQAAAIVRVFELSAENGLTRTAKQLNAERIVAPGGHGWSPSSVRTILHRRLYLGEGFWNQSQKRDRWGQKRQRPRPASEWERVTAPRIVSDELWNAAHARMATVRVRLTTAQGERPIVRRDVESSYLLSGFARCSVCGGTLAVVSRSHGRQRAYFYGCLAHWKRGTTACTNGLVLPVRVVEDAVLRSMRQDALRPAVVKAILDVVFEALKPAELESTVQGLGAELRTLDQRIARLTMAIEEGGTIAPLVAQLQTRQAERETLVASIAATLGNVPNARQLEPDRAVAQPTRWASSSRVNHPGRRTRPRLIHGRDRSNRSRQATALSCPPQHRPLRAVAGVQAPSSSTNAMGAWMNSTLNELVLKPCKCDRRSGRGTFQPPRGRGFADLAA